MNMVLSNVGGMRQEESGTILAQAYESCVNEGHGSRMTGTSLGNVRDDWKPGKRLYKTNSFKAHRDDLTD